MDFIKNEFIDDEVLLMYRCGSYAFVWSIIGLFVFVFIICATIL